VLTQQTPCDYWDSAGGVWFRGLALDVPMTLRASATGYTTVEQRVFPKTSGTADAFVLEELR
jgi:hypothetical protein